MTTYFNAETGKRTDVLQPEPWTRHDAFVFILRASIGLWAILIGVGVAYCEYVG